jgi:glycosyltransferase involved in cell wall biosynthesis
VKCVLILDPRGNINLGGEDTISRHDSYAREMKSHKKLKSHKLVVISNGDRVNIQPSNFDLKLVNARPINFAQFAYQAAKEIKRTKLDPSILVVGDPWESYWAARLTRFLSGMNCPIQVQLHGDFGNPVWKALNSRNRLRSYALGYATRNSESIRTVSEFQTEFIVAKFNIKRNKVFVCPPLLNSSYLNQKKNPRKRDNKKVTLAFIGRLHSERGTAHLRELVAKLKSEDFNFKLLVLGSGPEEKELKREISKLLSPIQNEFYPFLQPRDMASFWAQTDLVLSLAPSESYGRAMREALLFGIPVLAVESSGVKELIQLVGNQSVLTVNPKDTSAEIRVKVEKLLTAGVSHKTKNQIMEVELRKNSLLIESWSQTMKEFKSKGSR